MRLVAWKSHDLAVSHNVFFTSFLMSFGPYLVHHCQMVYCLLRISIGILGNFNVPETSTRAKQLYVLVMTTWITESQARRLRGLQLSVSGWNNADWGNIKIPEFHVRKIYARANLDELAEGMSIRFTSWIGGIFRLHTSQKTALSYFYNSFVKLAD